MKIGIAISHHNRPEVLATAFEHFTAHMPKDAKLVVVDDASDVPVNADFRFETNVGIARTKNKGIELLMAAGCDHLFLFDDDTYPIDDNWWKPYVESKEPHLMYNFTKYSDGTPVGDCIEVYRDDEVVAQGHPRGCMLYITADVVSTVGGFYTGFGLAMEEHVEYSQRIFNAKLTTFKFADVVGSDKLIYSTDWDKSAKLRSSIMPEQRQNWRRNQDILKSLKHDATFRTIYAPEFINRAVITSYFTSGVDSQRDRTWEADRAAIQPLIDSVNKHKEKIYILNDCGWEDSGEYYQFVKMRSYGNPYFWRWYAEYIFMRNANLDAAWLVDATDVEMLENPFEQMQPFTIYSGDEQGSLGTNQWMIRKTKTQDIKRAIMGSRAPILNCGVVGGSTADLMELCLDIWEMYSNTQGVYDVEMPIYNYLLKDKPVVHGAPVNTVFKAQQTEGAWWKHK